MLDPAILKPGEDQFEMYKDSRKKMRCQYDYRDFDGKLFSCVKNSYEECMEEKKKWLEARK